MFESNHSIRVVAMRTGLSPHVIRIWEKRYHAVDPLRTATKRRLYSEAEVERLNLLHQATELGHSIGVVAKLPDDQLREVVSCCAASARHGNGRSVPRALPDLGARCLEAVGQLDAQALEAVLREAALQLGSQGLLQKLIGPLAHEIGERWQRGDITAAQEHFASAAIRTFLGTLSRPFALPDSAPTLVVATPAGQLHELGAVMVAAAAAAHGWRVIYLGVSLPAAEIAGSALNGHAKAVALSIVYPKDDPNLPAELDNLRRYLPPEIKILAGGRGAAAYGEALARTGTLQTNGIEDLYRLLDHVRSPAETH